VGLTFPDSPDNANTRTVVFQQTNLPDGRHANIGFLYFIVGLRLNQPFQFEQAINLEKL
jgi:hypothetical protein